MDENGSFLPNCQVIIEGTSEERQRFTQTENLVMANQSIKSQPPKNDVADVEKMPEIETSASGNENIFCAREYLELFASFKSMRANQIQCKINTILAERTGSEMAFFILPSGGGSKNPYVNVIGNIELHEKFYPEFYNFKKSVFTRNLDKRSTWDFKTISGILVKTLMTIPIYISPEAKEAPFIIAFVNKRSKPSDDVEISSSEHSIIEFSESDETFVRDAMIHLSKLMQHLVLDTLTCPLAQQLGNIFDLCKRLLDIHKRGVITDLMNELMKSSLELIQAEYCSLLIPTGDYLIGNVYYNSRLGKEMQIIMTPNNYSIAGAVYTSKKPLNVAVTEQRVIYEGESALRINWLAMPVISNQNEVAAVMEFSNKHGTILGFNDYDESVAYILSLICSFCLELFD